jgi:hypothetical protein
VEIFLFYNGTLDYQMAWRYSSIIVGPGIITSWHGNIPILSWDPGNYSHKGLVATTTKI